VSIQPTPENGSRILVVDDEPSIVDAVAPALRYEGFEVDEATTGREALAAGARAMLGQPPLQAPGGFAAPVPYGVAIAGAALIVTFSPHFG